MSVPLPPDEFQRFQELASYDLLDTPPEPEFEQLTALAARLFRVPIAGISLMDAERQWFKSHHGMNVCETPRDEAFCSYTILGNRPFVVPDAILDPRFAGNPLVAGTPGIRFYAGAPLITPHGRNIGSLCLIDTVPRNFSEADAANLGQLAVVTMAAIEARRTAELLRQEIAARKRSDERLRILENSVRHANDAFLITEARPVDEPGPRIVYVNQAFTKITGYTEAEVVGKTPRILQGPNTDPETKRAIREALEAWEPICVELVNYRKDGSEFWVELNIVPVCDERGDYTHWVSVQREITAGLTHQKRSR